MQLTAGYEIRLVEANNISKAWKSFHIFLLVCAGVFGIAGAIALSFLYDEEDFLCATPTFSKSFELIYGKHQALFNGTNITLDFFASGVSDENCEYTLYTLITSFIFASIWVVFFMMCGRGGRSRDGLPKPWRIVLPALVFCAIFTFTSLGGCIQLTVAKNKFCYDFDHRLSTLVNTTMTDKCQELHSFMPVRQMSFFKIQSLMSLAEAMNWLCMTSWLASAGLCIARIIYGPDFHPVLHPMTDVPITPEAGYRAMSNTPSISSISPKNNESYPIASSTSVVEIHSEPTKIDITTPTEEINILGEPSHMASDLSLTSQIDEQMIKKVQFNDEEKRNSSS